MPIRAVALLVSFAVLAGCQDEAAEERACFERLLGDFQQSQAFGREMANASPWGSDEAISWSRYAVKAAESALSISVIHTDDDRNACDYVSNGNTLERK